MTLAWGQRVTRDECPGPATLPGMIPHGTWSPIAKPRRTCGNGRTEATLPRAERSSASIAAALATTALQAGAAALCMATAELYQRGVRRRPHTTATDRVADLTKAVCTEVISTSPAATAAFTADKFTEFPQPPRPSGDARQVRHAPGWSTTSATGRRSWYQFLDDDQGGQGRPPGNGIAGVRADHQRRRGPCWRRSTDRGVRQLAAACAWPGRTASRTAPSSVRPLVLFADRRRYPPGRPSAEDARSPIVVLVATSPATPTSTCPARWSRPATGDQEQANTQATRYEVTEPRRSSRPSRSARTTT